MREVGIMFVCKCVRATWRAFAQSEQLFLVFFIWAQGSHPRNKKKKNKFLDQPSSTMTKQVLIHQ
jgi:hypothetical protein